MSLSIVKKCSSRFVRIFILGVLFWGDSLPASPKASEPWKGTPFPTQLSGAVMPGLGLVSGSLGFALNGAFAFKILDQGFVDDINDQVYLEFQGGPLFLEGTTAFPFAIVMRWIFHYTEMWSFYSSGGLGGILLPSVLGNHRFYPRIAIGAVWNVWSDFSVRLSQEFIGAGIAIDFSV